MVNLSAMVYEGAFWARPASPLLMTLALGLVVAYSVFLYRRDDGLAPWLLSLIHI